jgi:DNA-3-methyladenine glycosylase II
MYQIYSTDIGAEAAAYLSKNDPILKPVITRAGLPTISPHDNHYWELIDSIISQQLSVKAASTIEKRFRGLFDSEFPSPDEILAKSIEELRTAGLSGAKAKYIQDLAGHIKEGKVVFDKLAHQSNQEIITELTDVKGIGEWTAHMFLIFSVGRLDILPTGDLGIRNGIRALYDLPDLPSPQQIRDLADTNNWHPYESIASWYIWHSLDNAPKT